MLDVNEPPSLISKRLRIAENSSPGTRVGQLRVTDEDIGQHSSCDLLNATAYFILEQVDSQLLIRVADHADIDYETSPSIRLNVECHDDGRPSLSTSRVFVVEVTDVNEPVTDIIVTGSRRLRADTPSGAVIANLTAVDEDRGQTHDFSLRGLVASAFKVSSLHKEKLFSLYYSLCRLLPIESLFLLSNSSLMLKASRISPSPYSSSIVASLRAI